jgi:hypothetical protein
MSFLRYPIALSMAWLLSACAAMSQPQPTIVETRLQQLRDDVQAMKVELERTRDLMQSRGSEIESSDRSIASRLDTVQASLETLPGRIEIKCPEPKPIEQKPVCKEPPAPKSETMLGKTVVGEKERLRLDPPGKLFIARIDTGATSSSLHAESIVQFERDGANWVRFELKGEDGVVSVEAPIKRYARVVQQADPKGSRRPVVSLRVTLGEIDERVEFTLADRSHLENDVLLGRAFLTDLAIVDVSRRFIQPAQKK